ncbi:MAG: acetoin dehydrogenase dihydrolipoyllysine-residue acetyltransferase subunit [Pseudomonadota bacterium]
MSPPPIHALTMPKWGMAMATGKIAAWLVREGQAVAPGDEMVEVESEKIVNAVEASDGGIVRRIIAGEGETLPVGALLAVIADGTVKAAAIDAFVAQFQKGFVPPPAGETPEGAAKTVVVDGVALAYEKTGAARQGAAPALLIHGFGGDRTGWTLIGGALAATRAVYALDLPGHGASDRDVGDGGLCTLAGYVVGAMDALGIDKAHLVGHSLGAAIALHIAATQPARAVSLSLIGAVGLGGCVDAAYLADFIAATRRKELKPVLEKLFSDPRLVTRQMVEATLKYKRLDGAVPALQRIAAAVFPGGRQAHNFRDRLADLPMPILALWGDDDRLANPEDAAGLPDNVAVRHVKAGHMAQVEAAGAVAKLLTAHFAAAG